MVAMRAEGLIHTFYRNGLRGHRLTAKAKDLLMASNPGRFSFYLTGKSETNQLKSEVARRLRLHRMAEALITMQNAGVSVFRDGKPDVFQLDEGSIPELPNIQAPAFFTSREVKEMGHDATGVRGSRMVGVLLAPDSIYVVYNTGGSLMKWDHNPELRAKTLMRVALCQQRLSRQYDAENIKALALGNDMELAYQLLTGRGEKNRCYFVADGNYDNFFFSLNDHRGEVLLRLLVEPDVADALEDALSDDLYEREHGLPIEHDALTECGVPVLFGWRMDMARIIRFNMALAVHGQSGLLYCFDFQAEVLRRSCCENVEIKSISFNQFERRLSSLKE